METNIGHFFYCTDHMFKFGLTAVKRQQNLVLHFLFIIFVCLFSKIVLATLKRNK